VQYSLSIVIVEPQGDGEEGTPGLEVAPGQVGPLVDGALVLAQLGKMGQGEGPEVVYQLAAVVGPGFVIQQGGGLLALSDTLSLPKG